MNQPSQEDETKPDGRDPNCDPARKLWVELATRITTQKLHFRSGNEETAATSVYSLFKASRELIAEHPAADGFAELAVEMLNETIRPYTARWHGWMTEDQKLSGSDKLRFRDEHVRRTFRAELNELSGKLRGYTEAFGQMAEPGAGDPVEGDTDDTGEQRRALHLGHDFPMTILRGVRTTGAQWGAIEVAERQSIQDRRESFWPREASLDEADYPKPPEKAIVGLAFSGGGIRAATYALGVTTGLAKKGLLPQIDYLSTVSGGGYLGAFLSSAFEEEKTEGQTEPEKAEARHRAIDDLFKSEGTDRPESPEIRHLRNNSKYLLNEGVPRMAVILISKILANLPIVFSLVLLLVGLTKILQVAKIWDGTVDCSGWLAPGNNWAQDIAIWLSVLTGGAWLTQLGFERTKPDSQRAAKAATVTFVILLCALLGWIASAIPGAVVVFSSIVQCAKEAGSWLDPEKIQAIYAALVVILPVLSGAVTVLTQGRRWLGRLAQFVFFLSGPLFLLCAYLFLTHHFVGLGFNPNPWPWAYLLMATAGVLFWALVVINANSNSLHPFYRDRLCECYLPPFESQKNAAADQRKSFSLQKLKSSGGAPYHLLNCAVNLPSSKDENLRGRNADFFFFSRHFCGSPLTGYAKTDAMEASDPHIDLGTAMAVSGAAANSLMGTITPKSFQFIITSLNIRLGYWAPNPAKSEKGLPSAWLPPSGLHLLRELFSKGVDENQRHVLLSDGGHIENLGVYELLRRRCKFIISVVGASDPNLDFRALRLVQRYAKIDLGVDIEIDTSDLEFNERGVSSFPAALGKIHYGVDENGEQLLGWLLVIQMTVTGLEPDYVLDYKEQSPTFPHETIADQFFGEAQFEAYRALGLHAAETLFSDPIFQGGCEGKVLIKDWFEGLAANLLPDNDKVFD
ncbi:MAG: hypothetical protein ACI8UO_005295 [Verrucomicrobiales bacterium]|jgi:hypothetical protein